MHLRGSGTFRPVSPVVFVPLARGISECERLEAQVRSGPLARETAFPYHPHVTVAHDLDEAALDRAFDALAAYDAPLPRLGLHPVRARAATASGARSATSPSPPADCPDRWSPAARGVGRRSWHSPTAAARRVRRERRPLLDHLVRAVQRYQADTGDRLAAAVTYYWFLSLFPIVLLAIALLGYVYGDDASGQGAGARSPACCPATSRRRSATTLEEAAGPGRRARHPRRRSTPGSAGSTACARRSARSGTRTCSPATSSCASWSTSSCSSGCSRRIGASVLVTGLVTRLHRLGAGRCSGSGRPRPRAAVHAGCSASRSRWSPTSRCSSTCSPGCRGCRTRCGGCSRARCSARSASSCSRSLGGIYVARTTSKGAATYGTFAVVVGLLLFLNLVSRLLLLASAFVVTAPYDSDVAPSGTASREQARKAGIPEEFADDDPDDPPNLLEDGAPDAACRPRCRAGRPPQDEPGRAGTTPAGERVGGVLAAADPPTGVAAQPERGPAGRAGRGGGRWRGAARGGLAPRGHGAPAAAPPAVASDQGGPARVRPGAARRAARAGVTAGRAGARAGPPGRRGAAPVPGAVSRVRRGARGCRRGRRRSRPEQRRVCRWSDSGS